MYVCSCKAITDRTVRAVVAAGAQSVDAVADMCSAGSRCGGCWPTLEALIAEGEAQRSRADTAVA